LIDDKKLAKDLTSRLLKASTAIERTVGLARESASKDEFLAYRAGVGKVLEEMLWELLNPIFKRHPDLKPKGWDSTS
jgi:hypothetical protein